MDYLGGSPILLTFSCLQQASHGKISKELVNRLMSIVGHLIQLRTLKVFLSSFYNDEICIWNIFLFYLIYVLCSSLCKNMI